MTELASPRLYAILEEASHLRQSTNPLVRVSAERIAAIVVDALLEVDPENFDNPWDALIEEPNVAQEDA